MSGNQNVNRNSEADPKFIKILQLLEDAKPDEAIKAIQTLTSTRGRSRSSPREKRKEDVKPDEAMKAIPKLTSARGRSRSSPREKRKRHNIRWNTELDLKLLLAIQYVCKIAKLAVPWDDIARVMGPAVTGSEILKHLATTRTGMVAIGLDVPPPLDFPGKIEISDRKIPYYCYNFDDNDEAWDVDDSDIEYGEPIAKRAKMSTEGSSKRKVQDGTDDGDHMSAEVIITGQRWLDVAPPPDLRKMKIGFILS